MTPLGEAREWVATALGGISGLTVYTEPPEVPAVPSVSVGPADPWIGPMSTYAKTNVALLLTVLVGMTGGNTNTLEATEEIVWSILALFPPTGDGIAAPVTVKIGQADLWRTEIRVHVLVED